MGPRPQQGPLPGQPITWIKVDLFLDKPPALTHEKNLQPESVYLILLKVAEDFKKAYLAR